jgi:hypothetical protein
MPDIGERRNSATGDLIEPSGPAKMVRCRSLKTTPENAIA